MFNTLRRGFDALKNLPEDRLSDSVDAVVAAVSVSSALSCK